MKIFHRIILLVLISIFIVGCFMPIIVDEKTDCQLVTKKLELSLSEKGTQAITDSALVLNQCHSAECILVITFGLLSIPITSIIVSGSIVVVGNTIHWIEKEGRCEDSVIRTAVSNLISSIQALGGHIIQSAKEFIIWLKLW